MAGGSGSLPRLGIEDIPLARCQQGLAGVVRGRTGCSGDDNNLNCDTGAALINIDMKDKSEGRGDRFSLPGNQGRDQV